jgi:hypothetical protein
MVMVEVEKVKNMMNESDLLVFTGEPRAGAQTSLSRFGMKCRGAVSQAH